MKLISAYCMEKSSSIAEPNMLFEMNKFLLINQTIGICLNNFSLGSMALRNSLKGN